MKLEQWNIFDRLHSLFIGEKRPALAGSILCQQLQDWYERTSWRAGVLNPSKLLSQGQVDQPAIQSKKRALV